MHEDPEMAEEGDGYFLVKKVKYLGNVYCGHNTVPGGASAARRPPDNIKFKLRRSDQTFVYAQVRFPSLSSSHPLALLSPSSLPRPPLSNGALPPSISHLLCMLFCVCHSASRLDSMRPMSNTAVLATTVNQTLPS